MINASPPRSETAHVESNQMVGENIWMMTAAAPRICDARPIPGQFVYVRVNSSFKPFLRRPLSICREEDERISLLYLVRGEGTRLLAAKRPGDELDLIGPLGQGFDLPEPDEYPVLIGGGIGAAPLLFHDYILKYGGYTHKFLLGVRSLKYSPLSELDIGLRNVKIAVEDGSAGFKGDVLQLLEEELTGELSTKKLIFCACGPIPMLIALKKLCLERGYEAQAALETPMGCGVGACQSCAVARADGNGYWLVCQDGPVFNLRDVRLDPGAGI